MAKKEYGMLFKLGAKLGQEFSSTFSSAQKILHATQKELQALNKQQSDISAYNRQKQSIEQSNQKLAMYQQQLANVRKEIAENGNASSALANKELELQRKIHNTETAIALKNERLHEMERSLNAAGIDTSNLAKETQKLQTEIANLQQAEEKAAQEAENYGNVGVDAFEAVGSTLATIGIIEGLNELTDAYKECVTVAAEFHSTMSTVEALSGSTENEMSQLTSLAKELGATTQFTAKQSADAMTYMGMAGWDAQEMMAGMDGVLDAAAASGEDLALVSDIITDNLTAFGLTAADTAHFSDVLAAAATNSNTSVSIMGETFKQSASIAGALGYSIEDVAVAVGLMANSGVKGSIAGTALKNTFNGLLEGATITSKAFGEVDISVINADGTMKDFSDTIDELRYYFEQMTEAERVNNAMAIAGQRGYNGLLAIINSTQKDYDSLTASINNCTGAAEKMSKIQLDNLKGDITIMDSAVEGLEITIGELYSEELRGLVQIGTQILTGIDEFCQENPVLAKSIMAIVAELGALVAIFGIVLAAKKTYNTLKALSALLTAKDAVASGADAAAKTAQGAATRGAAVSQGLLNTSMLASPVFLMIAAFTTLAAVTTTVISCNQKAIDAQNELTASSKQQEEQVRSLAAEYENAKSVYGETSAEATLLKDELDNATASFESNKQTISQLYEEIESLSAAHDEIAGSYNDTNNEIDTQYENSVRLIDKLRDLASESERTAGVEEQMNNIINKLNTTYPQLGLNIDNITTSLDEMQAKFEQVSQADSRKAKYDNAKETYNKLIAEQEDLEKAAQKAQREMNRVNAEYSEYGFMDAVSDTFFGGSDKTKSFEEMQAKYEDAWHDYQENINLIKECEAIMEEYGEIVAGTSDEVVSAYDAIYVATGEVEAAATDLVERYNEVYAAAYDSIQGQYSLWDTAAVTIPTSVESINTALETQLAYWNDYDEDLSNLLDRAEEIEGLDKMIASFADGSEESVNAIAGMAAASDEDLMKMLDTWNKLNSQQQETAESLADTTMDFEKELGEIVSAMETTVDQMNMDDEAAQAATATIQAYADALRAGRTNVEDAAAYVAAATQGALYNSLNNAVTFDTSPKQKMAGDMYQNQYASGTPYATAGYALVGENGPEIVRMAGGERVYNASDTRAIAAEITGGGQTVITIAPTFQVTGSGDVLPDLHAYSDQLVGMVIEALETAGVDARRSAYA